MLFLNARLTDDPTERTYSVQLSDGKIASIDPEPDHRELSEINIEEITSSSGCINLKGAYLAPSMVDNHVHFSVWAKARARVSLSGIDNIEDLLKLVKDSAAAIPGEQIALVGVGLMVGNWTTEDTARMTKETLDGLDRKSLPIVLILNDLHSMWCNSAALALLKFNLDSPACTGMLLEKDCFEGMNTLDALEEEHIWDNLMSASKDAASKGVTEITDLDIDDIIPKWVKRVQGGMDFLRVQTGVYTQYLDKTLAAGLKSGDAIEGGKGLLTVGPYKIITDGSLGTRTACCHIPYPSPPAPADDFGRIEYTPMELKEMFTKANDGGFRLAVHAIGDKTHTVIFDVMESLPFKPLDGSTIEHAQLFRLQDLTHFKPLGLVASVQPQHQVDDIELAERFWPTATDRAFAYKSLVDAGVELRLGSDAPVAPLDPWLAIAAAISRARPGHPKWKAGWHNEQRVELRLAYEASTSGRRLCVRPGDVADLCILEIDPLRASEAQLRNMKVLATMLEGRFTHNSLA